MITVINVNKGTRHLVLSWEDIDLAIDCLVPRIPFRPDIVLGITRGGVIPASLIHRCYPGAKLLTLRAKSYTGHTQSKLKLEKFPWKDLTGRRVLIVDDIWDTGATITQIWHRLPANCSPAACVIVQKVGGMHPTLITAFTANKDTWVVFPWERRVT